MLYTQGRPKDIPRSTNWKYSPKGLKGLIGIQKVSLRLKRAHRGSPGSLEKKLEPIRVQTNIYIQIENKPPRAQKTSKRLIGVQNWLQLIWEFVHVIGKAATTILIICSPLRFVTEKKVIQIQVSCFNFFLFFDRCENVISLVKNCNINKSQKQKWWSDVGWTQFLFFWLLFWILWLDI